MAVCCTAFTLLCLPGIYYGYLLQREYVISLAGNSFKEALTSDKVRAFKDVPIYYYYDPKKSTNNLPFPEKENYIYHTYISMQDSNRLNLDSIFRKKLSDCRLPLKSAVSVSYELKMHYSCPDKEFYRKAVALEPVVYRMDYTPKNRIELRGYIQLSNWFILQRVPAFYLLTIIWILTIAAVIGGVLLWNRRQQKKRQEKHTVLEEKAIEWIELPNGVSFDRIAGMLKYGDVTTQLARNHLKLFCLFLDSPNHFVSYKTIASVILKRNVQSDLTDSDKSSVYSTVSRLKTSFEGFPSMKIVSVGQKGYRLEFNR